MSKAWPSAPEFERWESKVNLPGWLTHGFGSCGGGCGSFQALFPSRGSCRCDSRLLTARTWSCRAAQLCQSQAGWAGHWAPVSATATQGTRLRPHTVLLTPTFPCSPSVQQKKSSNSDLRCDHRVPKNFSVLALLLIYSARAASALVGFLV